MTWTLLGVGLALARRPDLAASAAQERDAPGAQPGPGAGLAAMLSHLRRLATTGAAYTASSVLSKLIAVALLPLYTRYLTRPTTAPPR